MQLVLPLDSSRCVQLVRDGATVGWVRSWLERDGARVELTRVGTQPGRVVVALHAGPDGPIHDLPECWALRSRVPRAPDGDSLEDVLLEAETALGLARSTLREPCRTDRDMLEAVHLLLEEASGHAFRRLEPRLRRVARRYPRIPRYRIYRWLVSDRSGRVLQTVDSCPALLLIAASWPDTSRRIIDDIVNGVSQRAIVDWVAEWAEEGLRLHDEDPPPLAEAIRARRALIRRSGPSGHVPSIPASAFRIDDVPRDRRRCALWQRVMVDTMDGEWRRGVLGPCGRRPPRDPVSRAFAQLVSSRALELRALAHAVTGGSVKALTAGLYRYVMAEGRQPGSRTDLNALYRDCLLWVERQAPPRPAGPPVDWMEDDWPFPPGPVLPCRTDELEVTPIEDTATLIREGLEMEHCIADLLAGARRGLSRFYSIRMGKQRLTLELRFRHQRLEVEQLRGFRNRQPTRHETAAVRRWLECAGAAKP